MDFAVYEFTLRGKVLGSVMVWLNVCVCGLGVLCVVMSVSMPPLGERESLMDYDACRLPILVDES